MSWKGLSFKYLVVLYKRLTLTDNQNGHHGIVVGEIGHAQRVAFHRRHNFGIFYADRSGTA